MTSVAATTAEPAEAGRSKVPEIDPRQCRVNYSGDTFKEMVCRLPAGATADDLKEPALWRRVQGDMNKGLRKLDRVIIVAHDESALWEAYVSEAGASFANISTPKKHELKARQNSYFADGKYRVYWTGANFGIVRIADNYVMPGTFATEGLAIDGVRRLTPSRVSA